MLRLISAGDRKLMLRVNQWPAPRWFRRWMLIASRAGDGWLWALAGIAILCFGGDRRSHVLATGFVSWAIGLAVFKALKRVTGRERPCATETHLWATLLPPDRFSFPSGHTITAFAIAMPIGLYYPAFLVPLVLCSLSIAASRVVMGLHYLSDVVVGIVIGVAIGLGAFRWL